MISSTPAAPCSSGRRRLEGSADVANLVPRQRFSPDEYQEPAPESSHVPPGPARPAAAPRVGRHYGGRLAAVGVGLALASVAVVWGGPSTPASEWTAPIMTSAAVAEAGAPTSAERSDGDASAGVPSTSQPSPAPTVSPENSPDRPIAAGSSSVAPAPARVRYEISGSRMAEMVSFTSGGSTPVTESRWVRLPWRKEFDGSGAFVPSLSAQSAGPGPITCRIAVNGEELSSVTVEGTNAVAICTGRALS